MHNVERKTGPLGRFYRDFSPWGRLLGRIPVGQPPRPASGGRWASPIVGPVLGDVFGSQAGGDDGSEVDVDRSTRLGFAFAR